MRIIFILIILIFLFSVFAEGSDWEYFCSDVKGKKIYVDKENIDYPSKNLVRAWIKWICLKNCKLDSKYIKEAMTYEEYDCKERKNRLTSATAYYTDGTNDNLTGLDEWRYIRRYTIEERIHKYLCKDR